MITQKLVQELFYYDKDVGHLFTKLCRLGSNKQIYSRIGTVHSLGYRVVSVNGQIYKEHIIVWLYVYGSLPNKDIDHINGNKADNRLINLREASRSDNICNAKLRIDSKTGIKGICYKYKRGQLLGYHAKVEKNGDIRQSFFSIVKYGNLVKALEEAIVWVQTTREHLHGDFCNHG